MSVTMRAKMQVTSVVKHDGSETLTMMAVCKPEGYPEDGSDEDNSFARWTPNAELSMTINNPDLLGKFEPLQKFYVDFIEAEPAGAHEDDDA